MRILIAEDDPTSSLILQEFLAPLGTCDTAGDGRQAVSMFIKALNETQPYTLVCLDIMMPNMDGQTALRKIRESEQSSGIQLGDGAKIIMVTALDDSKSILHSFRENCEAYVVKPVVREDLFRQLEHLGLSQKK